MSAKEGTDEGPLSRNRDFVILWVGGAVSELGTSMSQLVFPIIGYAITHSTVQAGLATTGLVLGEVVLRLPAGALVDRVARSRVLLVTNLAAAAVYGSLAVAVLAGHLTLAHLVAAGFLSGAADAFAAPATSATVRTIVPTTQLPLAYTRLEARTRAVHLVGPPLGGALYSLARPVPFLVDAVSYAAEALAITRLRTPLPAPIRERRSIVADIGEGLRFVWDHVGVRAMMVWGGLINLTGGFAFVAVTLRLIQAGTRPAAIGLVETAAAFAGLIGALIAPLIISRAPTGLTAICLTLINAALLVPLAWTTNVVATGALLAAGTFLIPANNAGISAYMVSVVPDELQGRVNSAAGFISNGLAPLGPVLAGVALAALGGGALILGAALTAATVVPLVASQTIRSLGRPDTWAAEGVDSA
ncbi:MAG TPA: MFS transporter [Jatrophihabitantaceae bacterium]|nr:MFS transporter [Jatrophihabitantaceae bacterium]